jgi:hypothetical protein
MNEYVQPAGAHKATATSEPPYFRGTRVLKFEFRVLVAVVADGVGEVVTHRSIDGTTMWPEHSVIGTLRQVVLELEVLEYGTIYIDTAIELLGSTDEIKGESG